MSTPRTAFVTGANGFVGLNLVEALCADGWQVVALHRSDKNLEVLQSFDCQVVQGSITDLESLRAAVPEGVDALFHVAGSTSLWRQNDALQTEVNVVGTRNVVTVALDKQVKRMVHTSSIAAWGEAVDGTLDESMSQQAEGHWVNYFRTKWLAEQEVLAGIERGLDAVFINPANILGPHDQDNWGGLIVMLAHGKLPGCPSGALSFCHVREVARAHIQAVDKGRTGERYLIGGVYASYAEVLGLAAERLERKPPRSLPRWMMRAVGALSQLGSRVTGKEPDITPEGAYLVSADCRVSSDKAVAELGFQVVPLDEMVDDTIAWLREADAL